MKKLDQKQIIENFADNFNLTPRETEIVGQLLKQMTSTKQISESLGISTSTVRNHFENIFRKTNCENKCEVAVLIYKELFSKMKSFQSLARTPKVLVVEDNEVMCDVLATSIENLGMIVKKLTDAKEVLATLESERFDCVVSDIRMPDMDGVELLSEIRKSHPIWPFVILVSGHHDYDIDELLNFGAVAYVQKPFKIDEIFKLISDYFIEDLIQRNQSMVESKEILRDFEKEVLDLTKVSVGTGGAFISLKDLPKIEDAAVGSFYAFNVKLEGEVKTVQIAGEVVWKKGPEIPNPGVGIRFVSITPKVDEYIKKFISRNSISSFIPNI
ncbi:response regulator [Halobacteriovorax marinus]|uniref:response regulator n=1 Tax=Halobacteriovorax marinus TaxID=97084 RepID=UPI003A90A33B